MRGQALDQKRRMSGHKNLAIGNEPTERLGQHGGRVSAMAAATRVIRGDDPRLFGKGGRVRAARLFPLPASYTPGLRVLPTDDPELDRLYDQMAELLAQADALDPNSPTAARIAEVEREVAAIEAREADALRASFEDGLQMPIGAGQHARQRRRSTSAVAAGPPAQPGQADRPT